MVALREPSAIVRHARTVARRLAIAGVGGLLLLAIATAGDIAMRYLFASPIRGFVDLAALAGAVLLAACMPWLLVSRGNIAVDALGRRLGGRWPGRLDTFAALITAGFFGLMGWQYWRFSAELAETAQSIPVLRWPVWPWWAAVTALIIVTAIVGLVTASGTGSLAAAEADGAGSAGDQTGAPT